MAICLSADRQVASFQWPRVSWTAVFAWGFSLVALLFVLGLVGFLVHGALAVLQKEGIGFIGRAAWYYRTGQFGAASMLYGTGVVAGVAILCAVPLGFGAAIMTAECLAGTPRFLVKSLIELLAGIPSVVYGLLGVLFLRPFIFQALSAWHPETGDTLLTAGVLVGIMVLPTIISLSDDALRSVPREDRETAHALGLTRQETFVHAVLPKALPGLASAVLLGLGRALGETVAVYLVVGRADNRLPHPWYSLRPLLEAGQTLTSKLGGSEVNLAYGDPDHWSAIAGLGLVLFMLVIGCVLLGEGLLLFARPYRR